MGQHANRHTVQHCRILFTEDRRPSILQQSRFDRKLRIAHRSGSPYAFLTMTANAILNLETEITMAPTAHDKWWDAVVARDSAHDGKFFFAVSSTGVYCRPSCPAKRPRRENVAFFRRPEEAEKAGYRACLRCRPKSVAENPQIAAVKQICRYIEQHLDEPVTLEQLGKIFRLSPFHLQRTFKKALGITPKAYADSCRLGLLKRNLQSGRNVTDALYEAGYSSSSRLYERTASHLGMTPDKYRRGAVAAMIRYTCVDSPLGRMLVAATEKGICAIQFGDSDNELAEGLKREFPFAIRKRDDESMRTWTITVLSQLSGHKLNRSLPLDIQATAFQRRVWVHLQSLPFGATQSYGQVAKAIGQPTAVRAVARACASNRIAFAIPCHRVVRGNGEMGGYRWGLQRKKRLLEIEKQASRGRTAAASAG